MRPNHCLAALAGAFALGCAGLSAQAAPLAATHDAAKVAAVDSSAVQTVRWGHRHRGYYGAYGFSPYFYYGAPRFYIGPRYHRRHWGHRRHW